jgi:hypothetical protein
MSVLRFCQFRLLADGPLPLLKWRDMSTRNFAMVPISSVSAGSHRSPEDLDRCPKHLDWRSTWRGRAEGRAFGLSNRVRKLGGLVTDDARDLALVWFAFESACVRSTRENLLTCRLSSDHPLLERGTDRVG